MKENFSLNPKEWFGDWFKTFLIFWLKVLISGFIMSYIARKCGVLDNTSMKSYMKYLLIGSTLMYGLTFAYFAYKCKQGKLDYTKLAKVATLGPAVIAAHILLLILSKFIKRAPPPFGPVIYALTWTTIGLIAWSGVFYGIGVQVAEKTFQCRDE